MREKRTNLVLAQLRFNVAQLLKEMTGASRHYQIDVDPEQYFDDEELQLIDSLSGDVTLLRIGAEILVKAALLTTIRKVCARGLEPFDAILRLEIEEEFYPTVDIISGMVLPPPEEADEATLISDQHILDLAEVVRQEIALAADGMLYCPVRCARGFDDSESCRQAIREEAGLEESPIDARWAGLLALKEDDEET